MTTVFYPDCEATSPNGRFTLEARSPHALEGREYKAGFRYRLFEGTRVVWEREQGRGEDSPHELLVSDDGWSILRTHGYKPQVIAVSPDGHDEIQVFLRGIPEEGQARGALGPRRVGRYEWRINPPWSFTGGFFWARDSWPYFFQAHSKSWFVWRTSWGPRLLLDLTQGTALPEESPAGVAITHAMEEEEKRGAHRLLWSLSARLYEVQQLLVSGVPSIGEKPSPLFVKLRRVPPALWLVGLHRYQEALPVLRFWERLDYPGSSRTTFAMPSGWSVEAQAYRLLLHHSLRLLGAEPQGYATYYFRSGHDQPRLAVPEHVARRRERAAELTPGLSAEQVLQQVGSPDHIQQRSHPDGKVHRWTEAWEYDFRVAEQWVTLRLTWEQHQPQGRITHIQEEPASWLQSDKR